MTAIFTHGAARAGAFLAAAMAFCGSALASTAHIGGARVTKGKLSAEYRYSHTEDTGRRRMRQHLDYGVTDRYAFRLVVSQDKRRGDGFEHNGVTVENRFHVIDREEKGFDVGVRLNATLSDGDKAPHETELRLMTEWPFAEGWNFRNNVIVEADIGEDAEDGAALELRSGVYYDTGFSGSVLQSLKTGAEMFNGFGRLNNLSGADAQNHALGVALKGKLPYALGFQAGYRAGISDAAPDHIFRFALSKKF